MSVSINWIEWIEQCINEKHIKHYKYEKFNNIIKIGSGGFSQVYRANLKKKDFALKLFNTTDNYIAKEIVSEV
jgi:hypothetical protein